MQGSYGIKAAFLALYFTMTCMATVGFGNIAGNTASEKIFCIFMMVISGKLEDFLVSNSGRS